MEYSKRFRFLAVIGLLLATILSLTGCCAGYCSNTNPPVGSGVQHHGWKS